MTAVVMRQPSPNSWLQPARATNDSSVIGIDWSEIT